MSNFDIISQYESLSDLTSQMRDAAVQGEWDKLANIQLLCSRQVAAMRPVDTNTALDDFNRQRKIWLIKKILADDAEIRSHTEVWMVQLQRIMQSNSQERRLLQAYGHL